MPHRSRGSVGRMRDDVTITEQRCPRAAEHKTESNIHLRRRADGSLFCPVHGNVTYYHGTTNHRFAPGDTIVPGAEAGTWSNPQIVAGTPDRDLASGRTVGPRDVVWITSSMNEAENWAHHSTLKALPHEIRAMPAGGIAVYEVEPEDLDQPVERHGDGEACCSRARVIREVSYDPFPTDLCDECGETATEGLGTDNQLCTPCHDDERNNR